MVTDPISDLLTRIRNGMKARHSTVKMPYSKMKEMILKILEREKYIEKFSIKDEEHKNLEVNLQADKAFTLKRVSKPGRRIFLKHDQIKKVYHGYGIGIFSTNKGVMTDVEARKIKCGGEYLCEIF